MFFKRLSRSRSNSQSYVDSYQSPHDSKTNSASYDDNKYAPEKYDDSQRPNSSRDSNQAKDSNMYARQGQPTEVAGGQYASPPVSAGGARGGGASNGYSSYDGPTSSVPQKSESREPAPDLLLQAFNQALRPYTDKVGDLESEIADLRAYIEQLESQRSDVHAWIDKRGLRPGEYLLTFTIAGIDTDNQQMYHQV